MFDEANILAQLGLERDKGIPATPEVLGHRLDRLYHLRGYSYARTTVSFHKANGILSFRIDEGRFTELEFVGAGPELGTRLARQAKVESPGIFNRDELDRALGRLVSVTDDRLELDEPRPATTGRTSPRAAARGRIGAYELEERDGKRVLVVHVRRKPLAFGLRSGSGGREDAYSPWTG